MENGYTPEKAQVDAKIVELAGRPDNPALAQRAALGRNAIAFVHFDPSAVQSNMVEALVHAGDLAQIDRGLYVSIICAKDGRSYTGRIVEGPFYNPDTLKRDSTPVQFIILNQGQGKVLSLPEYHGWIRIEILGEETDGTLYGATRRPHPASPVIPYDASRMESMLHLTGTIRMGLLDTYSDVFVQIDGDDKGIIPRNWLTVGTVGSGKSNTTQVFIEETLAAGYAQVVVDPEGEYIFMDQPSDMPGLEAMLAPYERVPQGVKSIIVYRPPLASSKRPDARPFSVPFDSLSPELIVELAEMSPAQETRFTFLYEQATQSLRKSGAGADKPQPSLSGEDIDLSQGYPGITLRLLLDMLNQELEYYEWKRTHKDEAAGGRGKRRSIKRDDAEADEAETESEQMEIYCHKYRLEPLVKDHQDVTSYGALRKKLRELEMTRIFDRSDAPPLEPKQLCRPGHLSVIDMSDSRDQQVVNIVIADLLARLYHYKMKLDEEQNIQRKIILTIEEAHGFVSREKQDKMEQTLDQLRRIARRGRKRWLALHFVTQSPQHLPSELFELANNKIIHQTTGSDNLRVLKAAAGSVNEGIWNDVPSLGRGRAIVISAQYPHPIIARIRPAASKRNYTL